MKLLVVSYWYNFNTKDWSAIYKHKENKHLKWKAGYESDNRLGWASLWVRHSSTFNLPSTFLFMSARCEYLFFFPSISGPREFLNYDSNDSFTILLKY